MVHDLVVRLDLLNVDADDDDFLLVHAVCSVNLAVNVLLELKVTEGTRLLVDLLLVEDDAARASRVGHHEVLPQVRLLSFDNSTNDSDL